MPSHPWTLTRSLRRSFHCALSGPLWRPATARISAARTLCMRVSRFYPRLNGLGVCGCQPVCTLGACFWGCQEDFLRPIKTGFVLCAREKRRSDGNLVALFYYFAAGAQNSFAVYRRCLNAKETKCLLVRLVLLGVRLRPTS